MVVKAVALVIVTSLLAGEVAPGNRNRSSRNSNNSTGNRSRSSSGSTTSNVGSCGGRGRRTWE
eukprot:5653067-Pyramimonas_sp.AAC.1